MKTKFLAFGLLLSLLFVACAPQDIVDDETALEVTETSVSFGNTEETKSIVVTSSVSNWIATSPAEGKGAGQWLTLTQEGNVLSIKVAENTLSVERVGYIVISAAGANVKVEVKQAAADVELSVDPVDLTFKRDGGERIIDIYSNGEGWEVRKSEEVDWLDIKTYPSKGQAQISVKPNTTPEQGSTIVGARKTVLIASSGTKHVEITVVQKGEEVFLMPYLSETQSMGDLHKYEQENDRFSSTGSDTIFNFLSEAKHTKKVQYQYHSGQTTWKQALVFGDEHVASDEFVEYMKGEGFIVQFDRMKPFFGEEKRKIRFLRDGKDKRVVATSEFTRKYGWVVRFIMEDMSEGVSQTWDELPVRNLDLFNRVEATPEYIKNWEEAQKQLNYLMTTKRTHRLYLNDDASVTFNTDKPDQELQQSVWFLYVRDPGYGEGKAPANNKLVGTASLRADAYNTKEKVFKTVGSKMFANRDFLTLAKREGYELFGQVDLEYGWAWFLKDNYQVLQVDGSYGAYAVFRFEENPNFEAELKK